MNIISCFHLCECEHVQHNAFQRILKMTRGGGEGSSIHCMQITCFMLGCKDVGLTILRCVYEQY